MAFKQSTIRNPSEISRHDKSEGNISALPAAEQGILRFFKARVKGELVNERYERITNDKMRKYSSNEVLPEIDSSNEVMSTTSIIKLARARVREINSRDTDVFTILERLVEDQRDMPAEIFQDFEIAVLVQAAAEKFAWKQFSWARKLIFLCYKSASKDGTPVQRTVFYFVEALEERMDHELGIIPSLSLEEIYKKPVDVIQTQMSLDTSMLVRYQEFDILAIIQFTGIQSILDNVASAKKIHLIDFRIRNGCQLAILMQGLAHREECPVEHLTITAVGTCRDMMEATGWWLSCSAATLGLSFSFQTLVLDLKDLRADMFKFEDDEHVAIYCQMCLFPLNACPGQLQAFIGVIKDLRPCVTVISEMEANLNSVSFVERFSGAIDYFSAVIDLLSIFQGQGPHRKHTEEVYVWERIKNIVTTEAAERVHRYRSISSWRASFEKYGLVETELSPAALLQARLLIEMSPGRNSCTMEMDGECMLLGWKGSPLFSNSAWKCQLP